MRRWWSADELVERWSLTPEDLSLLVGRIDAGKLGLAAQLAYWRRYGAFPDEETDLAPEVIAHLAAQVGVGAGALDSYDWSGRTGRRHRQAILNHLAITNFEDVVVVHGTSRVDDPVEAVGAWPDDAPTRKPRTDLVLERGRVRLALQHLLSQPAA